MSPLASVERPAETLADAHHEAFLEGIGVAVPPHEVTQASMRAKAEEIFSALAPELVEKLSVFETVGIRKRDFVRPMDWYLETHGWADRSAVFAEAGLDLLEQAAREALRHAELPPDAIDGVIVVTTTGIATPSLDARLIGRLGLRADVTRAPLWGLGCAGGVAGLNVAADLARANPDKRYLLLCLETCSLAFNMNDMSVRAFVATTLFGDGCAALIVRGDRVEGKRLATIDRGASHTWPDSLGVMGWDVLDDGLRVVFSRRIPDIVATEFAPIVGRYLKTHGIAGPVDVERFVFHPGGTKVLESYAEALALPAQAFDLARATLREHGNMSSPTVHFVLRDSLSHAPLAPGEKVLLAALGPGFSAELALLRG